MKQKTLLVGLDAACWEYVNPLLQAGRMPTLHRLIDTGIWGTMHSTMPPWTPTAWASLATGKNPGKHGIFDMIWRRPGTFEFTPTNNKVRSGVPFWNYLNASGLRVGLVNVPFTYPPEPLDGFVVTGFGTPNSAADVTCPSELLSWIEQEFGEYEPTVTAEFLQTASPSEILAKEVAHQARQVQIAAALANQFQVDVLVINLMLTDHANHKMPSMEQVQEAYCQADSDLGYLLDAFQPDNALLISDHGSNRLKGDFLLDAWLRDQGYYVQVENGPTERLATFNWLLGQWLQKHHQWSGVAEKLCRHLIHRSFFRLPHWLQGQFWKRMEAILPFAREHVYFSNLPDYERTVVFPGSTYAGLLYLHIAGDEFTGIAPPERRESLKAEIAAKLLEVKEPKTGRPLFAHVYTAEELYTGPAVANAPDLILDSYDMGWNIRASKYASLPGPAHDQYFVETMKGRDFGWHSRDGIFVFSGPAFGAGPATGDGHLVDVPATLLHLHGVPIPEDYDGQVLTELMSAELRERPIRYQPGDGTESQVADDTYSVKEAEEVLNHLRALGYVD